MPVNRGVKPLGATSVIADPEQLVFYCFCCVAVKLLKLHEGFIVENLVLFYRTIMCFTADPGQIIKALIFPVNFTLT